MLCRFDRRHPGADECCATPELNHLVMIQAAARGGFALLELVHDIWPVERITHQPFRSKIGRVLAELVKERVYVSVELFCPGQPFGRRSHASLAPNRPHRLQRGQLPGLEISKSPDAQSSDVAAP
jgi:hypothetical protein